MDELETIWKHLETEPKDSKYKYLTHITIIYFNLFKRPVYVEFVLIVYLSKEWPRGAQKIPGVTKKDVTRIFQTICVSICESKLKCVCMNVRMSIIN